MVFLLNKMRESRLIELFDRCLSELPLLLHQCRAEVLRPARPHRQDVVHGLQCEGLEQLRTLALGVLDHLQTALHGFVPFLGAVSRRIEREGGYSKYVGYSRQVCNSMEVSVRHRYISNKL